LCQVGTVVVSAFPAAALGVLAPDYGAGAGVRRGDRPGVGRRCAAGGGLAHSLRRGKMPMWQEVHNRILDLGRDYYRVRHHPSSFVPGQSRVPYAGRVFDEQELVAAVGSVLDFWLTLGPQGEAFERELAAYVGTRHALLVNSGSSANLVAFASLTSRQLDRPL